MNRKNNRVFPNLIFIIFVVLIIIVGLAIIKAVDNNRFQTEKLHAKIVEHGEALKRIEMAIKNGAIRNKQLSESSLPVQDINIANLEFFDKNATQGGSMIIPVSTMSKNLNNLITNDAFVSSIWGFTGSTIAARNYNDPNIFEPLLAQSWELSEDKQVYTIHLRKGVLWHDFKDPVSGKTWENVEVTADDFKFYLEVIKNEDVDCAPIRTYYKSLDRIEIIDRYTFKVYWSEKYFLSESSTLGLSPLPKHFYYDYEGAFDGKKFNDDFERNKIIVGCGPYFLDKWDAGQKIILKKWNKYFGENYGIAPAIETIEFELIKHPNTQFQALLSGEVGRMNLTSDQWINRTNTPEFDKDSPDFKINKFKYPSRAYSYIGYNLNNELFQDVRIRKALTHLVDREKILNVVYNGLGRIVTGNFFIDSPFYDKNLKPYSFSIEKATELLHEAGWTDSNNDGILDKNGVDFKFTILTISSSENHEKMFPLIREDMKKAGILMNINKVEWSVYVQRLEKKNFDAVSLGWSMGIESDPYQIWHSSMADIEGSSNHISFKNETADRLIEKIRTCFDLQKRIELCHEFHALLYELQPYTFLFCQDSLVAVNNRYQNVRLFDAFPIIPEDIMWVK